MSLILARVRITNQHGYLCQAKFVTSSTPGKYDKRTTDDLIRSFAVIGFPNASEVGILDQTQVPDDIQQSGRTSWLVAQLNMRSRASEIDSERAISELRDLLG